MENVDIANKLNSDLNVLLNNNLRANLQVATPMFYSGDGVDNVCKIVSKIAPYGKVAVVYTKNGFTEYSKALTSGLKKIGAKPLNFIMPDVELLGGGFSLENLFELFYFPEDVRAVITLEESLINEICYYASILDIPAVYCVNKGLEENFLPYRVFVKNKFDIDEVIITCNRHIIIDQTQILNCSDCAYKLFACIQSKISAYIDYNFNALIENEYDLYSKVYNYAVEAQKESYSILEMQLKDRNLSLLYNSLKISLANFLMQGKLLDNSSIYQAVRLLKNGTPYTMLNLLKKILGVYELYLSDKYLDAELFPDYNKRAESLSFATGEKTHKFINNFENQLQKLNEINKKLPQIKKALYEKVVAINNDTAKIFNTYFALNGQNDTIDNLDINIALKYSGDLSTGINIMSLVRESGITELFN